VGLNLANGLDDVVGGRAVGEEEGLGDGDGGLTGLPVAFQLVEAVAVGFEPRGAPQPLEAAGSDCLIEQAVVVLLVLDPAARHAFG
jgi:hypothetical protein